MAKQYHVHLNQGDCAPYVLLPGDPSRVHKVTEVWDTSRQVALERRKRDLLDQHTKSPREAPCGAPSQRAIGIKGSAAAK